MTAIETIGELQFTPHRSPGHVWTDEDVSELERLWARGDSASMIARAFDNGLSRSAIIGKVHRLGLPARRTISTTPRACKPRRDRARRLSRPIAPSIAPLPVFDGDLPPHQSSVAVGFLDRRSGQCAFILDDGSSILDRKCCGAPVAQRLGAFRDAVDTSWCARHAAIVYQRSAA